ncbi:MAG: aryl-sulfate sulfotransferase [Candidatus Acidiferrales bacterium]
MMKTTVLALAFLCSFVVAGCSSSKGNAETISISPTSANLITGQSVQFQTNISTNMGTLVWSVNGTVNGNASVGTIDSTGKYISPAMQPSAPVTVTVAGSRPPSATASAIVNVVGTGQVAATAHPQVALYTISPPTPATIAIQFGTDTTYGLTTWSQPATGNSAPFGMLVAGMKANTLYHMRAVLQFGDGSQLSDMDHTFTTGAIPTGISPSLTVANPNGMVPQSGVEMLDLISGGNTAPVVVSDLMGNVLWWYKPTGSSADIVQPLKPLPNGHVILTFSPNPSFLLNPTVPLPDGTVDVVREIDLTGSTIREISLDTLNSRLASGGFSYTAGAMHHDVTVLPNGHWIVLLAATKTFTDLPGRPGTTTVLGDALVDLDTNLNPVWLWDSFDHLDINRHPFQFPDWTHSNAILYSSTDGNLLLSIRHQNWIIKIDYADGKGTGDVVWHLGQGGEFTLQGGVDPTDWFYAQHGPSFTTATTAGKFGLTVFDNGDDRIFPDGETCASTGSAVCPYSTVQILNIDEDVKTATFAFHDIPSLYSFFGGNAEQLRNGDVEFDLCDVPGGALTAQVNEVTPTSPAQTVWQMTMHVNAYRAFRLGSLYPGVQW